MAQVKRSYDMTRRRDRAEATRREVLDAAGALFTAQGYAATTIDEIAAVAGVSRETVFKAVGTKRQVLRLWVERQVAGPAAAPMREQAWMRELERTPGVRRKVEIVVATAVGVQQRAGSALEVLRAATHADRELAALWETAREQRRSDVRAAVALIVPGAGEETVDVVHALTGPELYDQLVGRAGWAAERFERWLVEAVLRTALDPH